MGRLKACLIVVMLAPAAAAADSADEPPTILTVAAPERLRVGTPGEIRLTYRARQGNVVAVVRVIDDLESAGGRRVSHQREFGVIARAFGREAGELVVPLSFQSPGRKRVALTLVTDERDESEPAIVEVEATP